MLTPHSCDPWLSYLWKCLYLSYLWGCKPTDGDTGRGIPLSGGHLALTRGGACFIPNSQYISIIKYHLPCLQEIPPDDTGGISKLTWTRSFVTKAGGVGLDELQRSLPALTLLELCGIAITAVTMHWTAEIGPQASSQVPGG